MSIPYRRCCYLSPEGHQCEEWFPAIDSNKLCKAHREIISPSEKNGNLESKVKYIDLVNDERKYCYHFQDGTAQCQSQTLIYEFKDDEDGTAFDKLDAHQAFLDKVIADLKARAQTASSVKREKLDSLSEEQRAELRKIKIEKFKEPKKEKVPTFKGDPIAHLAQARGLSQEDAKELLTLDTDALLAKFEQRKREKENKSL